MVNMHYVGLDGRVLEGVNLKGFVLAAFLVALTSSACSPVSKGCSVGGVAIPLVHVANVDGLLVDVSVWQGMSPVPVATGTERSIFPTKDNPAPPPPWHLTIWESTSGKVLLVRDVTRDEAQLAVTIRSSGITVGQYSPST